MKTIVLKEIERTPVNKMAKMVTTYNPQNWYNNLPDFNEPDLTLDEMVKRLNFLIGSRVGAMEVTRFKKTKSRLLAIARCDCGFREFRNIKKWLIALNKPGRSDECARCKKARYFRMRAANST